MAKADARAHDGRFESAGWLFWGIGVAVLVGPAIYFSSMMMFEGTPVHIWVLTGIVIAVLLSGVITASANSLLQRAARNRRAAERKKSRK